MNETTSDTRPTIELRSHSLLHAFVDARVVAAGLVHDAEESWSSEAALDAPYPVIASSLERGRREIAMLTPEGSIVTVAISGSHVACEVHATCAERATQLVAEVHVLLPDAVRERGDDVAVHFWSLGHHGRGHSIRRMIRVPAWADIEANYHAATRVQLASLLSVRPDADAGKLVLWHGAPGTGKTWALRALIREWSSWATAEYITDPEQFFGGSPTYMQTVILDHADDRASYGADDDDNGDDDEPDWRLVVMEDTGELLANDAKQQLGQGLSRLLNVCDGLIGQGLRVIVLITTNEELGTMHPAVTRAGRCLANVRFDPLSVDEVHEWADRRGVRNPPRSGLLADLFSGDASITRLEGIGFRAPAGVGAR
jgi:hypothetical protein